ncbi:MAG: Smr/MutS family protein [Candidatus Pacebacteria bacterium]|nr:Smr/MutS family protein [Candidatus Paceibacterota bacterium]
MTKKKRQKKDYTPTIDAELDLHGYFADEARVAVLDFLREARPQGWSRVRIVVGKGIHSVNGKGVLPDVIKSLLNREGYTYTYAKLENGGEGALEIML